MAQKDNDQQGTFFDPSRAGVGDAPEQPARRERARYASLAESERLSVGQLARLIGQTLRDHLPAKVRVVGQVSGASDRTHWYFQLKDEEAVVGCVMFASQARGVGFTLENGMEVVATGRVEHYAKQGRTQFYVEKLERVGVGELELRFRALCEELRGLGWFDVARKRPLPAFPKRLAVVTSKQGAALQDVLDTLRRRAPMIDIAVVDVRVQGERAAPEIARALDWLSAEHAALGVDAVILTRGGGSTEDLWAFNERAVAESIVRSAVPVVAAIGHETDTTIAELVADERAATPTQAAMRLSPDAEALGEQVDLLASRLSASLRRRLAHDTDRVRGLARRPFFASPGRLLEPSRERLGFVAQALENAQTARVSAAKDRLASLCRTLEAVSPLGVLGRGYSVTLRADGSVLRSAQRAEPGETLTTRVADGAVRSVVTSKGEGEDTRGGRGALGAKGSAPGAKRGDASLFD